MWLQLGNGSFVNLGAAVRAYDTKGRFCVILGDAPGHELWLEGKDADKARLALALAAKRLDDDLSVHKPAKRVEDVTPDQRPPL